MWNFLIYINGIVMEIFSSIVTVIESGSTLIVNSSESLEGNGFEAK